MPYPYVGMACFRAANLIVARKNYKAGVPEAPCTARGADAGKLACFDRLVMEQ